jgi:hypothetical protein
MPPQEQDQQHFNDIENRFTYHAPVGDQPQRYQTLRQKAKEFAFVITACSPKSREQSLALTHLEEVCFWANASIARHDPEPVVDDFKQRVKAEKMELDAKLGKLSTFLANSANQGLILLEDWCRLLDQQAHMRGYANVLQDRIDHFPK